MINKSIILCSYNEVEHINIAIEDIRKNILNAEIILVDDNSNDGTANKLSEINPSNDLKIIIRKRIKGLASAFTRGLIETRGEYIGWIDINMTYLTLKFTEMEKMLNDGSDIVILSRYINDGQDKRTFLRSLSSKYLNIFCKFIFRSRITDFTTGIFLMKRSLLNDVSLAGYGHGDFFIEFLYNVEKKGFKVSEVPYIQEEDLGASNSKTAPNTITFIHHGIKYIIRIIKTLITKN